ncbi:methyl-accepting chemotaxis protein [Aneurinibacillus terranovensis]|uniref:methyl-accepting chemotaxis protein n=1 Tax=Aneurinibacillus terranovensis TaxID=278991 RepID=UPI0004146EB6|nr:HAMP domain-containing methyl-accepting chemotaxis protein [Aneurinibacillus terranovensis]
MKKKKLKMSVTAKLVSISLAILLLFGLSTMTLAYFMLKNSNLKSMDKQLNDTSTILAEQINRDKLKSIMNEPNDKNPDVLEATKNMDKMMGQSAIISNLYIITSKNGSYYAPTMSTSVLKTGAKYDTDMVKAGLSPDMIAAVKRAFEEKKVQATAIYGDAFGQYKTGFAPILDENGTVLAVYAVDYDVSSVTRKAWAEALNIFYFTLLFIVIFGVVLYAFIKKMVKPIVYLSEVSRKVADGNLEIELTEVKTEDEIGTLSRNFATMVNSLRGIIQKVTSVSSQVSHLSTNLSSYIEETTLETNQISASIQEIASGTEVQVSSASSSAQSIEELAIGIQRIAETSVAVSEASITTAEEAQRGNQSTQKAVQQMDSISKSVNKSASIVQSLGNRSQEIVQIVEIIAGIASQTNLLALNAAIEAARAGEQGRGFAVVADEVRKLAEQSEESARQIADLVQEIQGDTSHSITAMNQVVEEVQAGLDVVQHAENAFCQIQKSIENISDQIRDVSSTSQEMAASSQEVTASVEEIEQIARSSSDSTQAVAASSMKQLSSMKEIHSEAQLLRELVEELQQAIHQFKL